MDQQPPATTTEKANEAIETIEVLAEGEPPTGELMACCKAGVSNARV